MKQKNSLRWTLDIQLACSHKDQRNFKFGALLLTYT